MNTLVALLKLIRMTMVLAVVTVLALGALAAPLSAAHAYHASTSADDGMTHAVHEVGTCSADHVLDSHDAGDGSCCVGTCTTILGVAPSAHVTVGRISEIEPSDNRIFAQANTIEFIRPPRF
ncbi:hypothetical protein [Palleronia sp. THAF1]|uniref:hypothetical protein n=1 Tax=Palleronia sp. THAF1 TaxID=2587842 RepID=UPI000F53B4A6|nr:hypothetical protein [Palleronia sp. THAF1]